MTRGQIEYVKDGPLTNVEAEAALLGALMIDNDLIDRVADIIREADFSEPLHGRIYGALMLEHDHGRKANPVTLKPYFTDDPAAAQLGGPGYLAQLTGNGIAVIGTIDFAHQIADLSSRRRLSSSMGIISRAAENYEIPIEQLKADGEAALAELEPSDGSKSLHGSDAILMALDTMGDDQPPGVACHIIPSLDRVLGTVRPGHLVIIAARPGQGKTATALSYAHGAAQEGHGVLFVSLEMRAPDLGGRLACDVAHSQGANVPYALLTEGGANPEQRRAIARAAALVKQWPLWIEDLPDATVGRLKSLVRQKKRRAEAAGTHLRVVIVDYLQLLAPDAEKRDLYTATTIVSRKLKALAKAEEVGLIALCQLSRKTEEGSDKRPRMDHLRDSGQIEQDADTICFLLREEEYLLRSQPKEGGLQWDTWRASYDKTKGKIEFIVDKRRFGRPGKAFGAWLGEFQAVRG